MNNESMLVACHESCAIDDNSNTKTGAHDRGDSINYVKPVPLTDLCSEFMNIISLTAFSSFY